MLRTARHNYVRRHEGPTELYDLDADPAEEHNLAGHPAHADVERDLGARLTTWFRGHALPDRDGFARPVTGLGQAAPTWAPLTDGDRYV